MNSQMLAEIQNQFWSGLKYSDNEIISAIHESDDFKSTDRFGVYRSNARYLHVSVLISVFPVCEKILGNENFKQIAKKYFNDNPSCSPDLNEYGEYFPSYLYGLIMQRAELEEYKYLVDLAQLEWNRQKAYFCDDAVDLDMTVFQQSCERMGGEIVFSLQPGISILETQFPIVALWEMYQSGSIEKEVKFIQQSEYLCVYRKEFQVQHEKIDADIFNLMKAIQNKCTLSAIAEIFQKSARLNAAIEKVIKRKWLKV